MNATLTYYAEQGRISDPRTCAHLFEDLSASLLELVELVHNVTIHVFWVERYGLTVAPERLDELQLRTMERRLT